MAKANPKKTTKKTSTPATEEQPAVDSVEAMPAADSVEESPASPVPVVTNIRNHSSRSLTVFSFQTRIDIPGHSMIPVDGLPSGEVKRLISEYPFLEVVAE